MSLSQQLANLVKVRVTKKNPDTRTSLYGEPLQKDADGTEFFIVPSHLAEYTKKVHTGYEVGEEFIPDDGSEKDLLQEAAAEAVAKLKKKG
jgi:hypothetical protein